MKCILQMFSARKRAHIYYRLARSWGIVREKLKLAYTPDSEIGLGISWFWMVQDPIFEDCAKEHDAYYATLKPGDSSLKGDLALKKCMLEQAKKVESGELVDPWRC